MNIKVTTENRWVYLETSKEDGDLCIELEPAEAIEVGHELAKQGQALKMERLVPKRKPLKFTKSKWPGANQPFCWKECYFLPGDKISWEECLSGARHQGVVQRVRVNKSGRISYYAAGHDQQIQIEDVARAECTVPRGCVP